VPARPGRPAGGEKRGPPLSKPPPTPRPTPPPAAAGAAGAAHTHPTPTTLGAVKVGLVPVNTNSRYGDDELSYLWENADAIAVVFHGAFTDRIEGILDRVPGVKGWLWVDDGSGPCPDWATPYEDAAKAAVGRVSAPWGRSGDDLYMLYTGGTTGMPKGVMWRQDDL